MEEDWQSDPSASRKASVAEGRRAGAPPHKLIVPDYKGYSFHWYPVQFFEGSKQHAHRTSTFLPQDLVALDLAVGNPRGAERARILVD